MGPECFLLQLTSRKSPSGNSILCCFVDVLGAFKNLLAIIVCKWGLLNPQRGLNLLFVITNVAHNLFYMRILIANDDGYQSPGIRSLHEAMSRISHSIIVAPDRNRSGASNALTLTHPIKVTEHAEDIYSVEGTPADCVNIALSGLLKETISMVVSGINDGPNMGDDVLYSGTVAAAMEGRFLGTPALALSMATHEPSHFDTAADVAVKLVSHLSEADLPTNMVLNVNVPDVPTDELAGFALTRLGTRHPSANAIAETSPRGDTIFWIGPAGDINDDSAGTDFHAVKNNYVSITPVTTDLTKTEMQPSLNRWLERLR